MKKKRGHKKRMTNYSARNISKFKENVVMLKAKTSVAMKRKLLLIVSLALFAVFLGCSPTPRENPPRSNFPAISVYKNGIYLAWQHAEELEFQIYFNKSENKGKSWSKEVKLSEGSRNCSYPNIITEGSNLYIVWGQDQGNGLGAIMLAKSADKGKTWGRPKRITRVQDLSEEPKIAVNGKNLYMVYEGEREDWCEVCFKKSEDGGKSWSEEVNLSQYKAVSNEPEIVVEDEKVYIIWHDKRDGQYEIYMRKSYDQGNSWTEAKRLTFVEADSYYPSLAVDNGALHVVWHDLRNGDAEIYYKRSKDGGETWDGDVRLTKAKYNSFNPHIIAEKGKLFVSWEDLRRGHYQIYFNRSEDGGDSWSKDQRLIRTQYGAGYTEMAKWKNGIYIVWTDTRTGADQVYFISSFDLGKSWSRETRITR